eukprot:10775534-Lingulodinium_polyedra.AAC.1
MPRRAAFAQFTRGPVFGLRVERASVRFASRCAGAPSIQRHHGATFAKRCAMVAIIAQRLRSDAQ